MPDFPWPTEHFQGTPKYYNDAKQLDIATLRDLMMERHAPMPGEQRDRLMAQRAAILAQLRPQGRAGAARLSNKQKLELKKELDGIDRKIEIASGFTLNPEDIRSRTDRIGAINARLDAIRRASQADLIDPNEVAALSVEKSNLERELASSEGGKEYYVPRTPPTVMQKPKLDDDGNVMVDEEGVPIMEPVQRVVSDTADGKLRQARDALRAAAAGTTDFATAKRRITGNEDAIQAANDLISQGAAAPDQENIAAYMNPYTDRAMENLEADTLRALKEKLLPEVYGRNMGMNFNTGARQRQEEKLLRDVAESLHRKRAEIQLHGQDQALKLASAGKERELTAGRARGEIASGTADRNIREAETLGNLEMLSEADKLTRADVMHQTAEREQRQLQRERDMEVRQFETETEAPFLQAQRYSALLNGQGAGLPTHTFQASSPGTAPEANIGTVVGGALSGLAGLTGMNRQRGQGMFAKGGRVHRAGGGMMNQYGRGEWMKPPSEEEMAPYMASPELEQARAHYNTDNSSNPFWAGLAKMGANMMTHATKSPLEAFAASGPQFHEGYTGAMNEQKEHAEKAAQFNMLLHKSRLDQQNAMTERKFQNEQMAMQESLKLKELGEMRRLHDAQIDREKAHAEKYRAQATAAPKTNPAHHDEADKEILKKAVIGATAAKDMIANLDQLNKLADKVGGGTATAQHEWTSSPYKQSRIHSISQSDIELFDKIAHQLVIDAAAKFGQRGGARIAALVAEAKPNRKMTPDGIRQAVANIRRAVDLEAQRGEYVLGQTDKGISPKKALLDFEDQYEKETENKSLAPQGAKKAEQSAQSSNASKPVNKEEILRIARGG